MARSTLSRRELPSSSLLLAAVLLASAALWPAVANAQQSGWVADQINATMCYWEAPRAGVIRDTLYIDGGDLWWIPGMRGGSYGAVSNDGNPYGLVYTLNFSQPFNTARDNISGLLQTLSKAGNGGGAANNLGPTYLDGAMLANDGEFFLYGGLYRQTAAYSEPSAQQVLDYQAYQYGVDKPAWAAGFAQDDLPSNMTRYLAYGGAASAPSENKAYYFSGLHAPGWGPIYTVNGNDSQSAVNASSTLLTLDMTTQQAETWSNQSLPSSVAGRANPELVWVPVGAQGILVAVGGVTYPEYASVIRQSENEAASKRVSPGFLTTVDVYDIANKTWYQQPTAGSRPGSPDQLTRGCTVLATAADASSYNIYWYGGYDGLDATTAFVDDVYVLSLPSFTWVRVAEGNTTHARAGHKCVTPYPDQMFVVGGYTNLSGVAPSCIEGGVIQIFNLSSAEWITDYDPRVWSNYSVPNPVVQAIGGDGQGGATATQPAATGGWADAGLQAVFSTPYPTSKITHYYPYSVAATNTSGNGTNPAAPTDSASDKKGGSHVPSYLPPLLGVILGLVFVTACCVGFLLWRRRRLLFKNGRRSSAGVSGGGLGGGVGGGGVGATESDASTYDTGRNFVFSWLRAQPSVKQSSTFGTSSYEDPPSGHPNAASMHNQSSPVSPEMDQVPGTPRNLFGAAAVGAAAGGVAGAAHPSSESSPHSRPVEVENTFIAEMADTSHPAELQDTGLSPTDIVERHSRLGSKHRRFFGSGGSFSYIGGATTVHGGQGSVHSSDKASGAGPTSFASSSTAELDSNGVSSNSGASGSASRTTGTTSGSGSRRPAEVSRPDSPPLGMALGTEAAAGAAAGGGASATSPFLGTTATRAPAHPSGVSEISEADRAHLRKTSEGGSSVASSGAGSAMVSPIGAASPLIDDAGAASAAAPTTATATTAATTTTTTTTAASGPTAGRPQPIPEAEAGAEAEAEAAAERHSSQQAAAAAAAQRLTSSPTHSFSHAVTASGDPSASVASLQPPSPLGQRPRTASSGSGPRKSVFRESKEDMSP